MKKLKLNFTSRRVIRLSLAVIGALTLFAVALMILNEKSLHDTITDIIVLVVGAVALVMAVLTEAELEKQEKRSREIHKEILLALGEIRDINRDNEYLKRKIREEFKIDRDISAKLDDLSGAKK